MMLWCELHNSSGVKGGITNFDPAEYEKDLSWLQVVNQVRAQSFILLVAYTECCASLDLLQQKGHLHS